MVKVSSDLSGGLPALVMIVVVAISWLRRSG
jgi:hypothetical protein